MSCMLYNNWLIDKIELTIVLVRFIYFTLLKRLAYKVQNTMLGLASLRQSLLLFLWWLANAALARCLPTETTSVVTKRASTEHYARSPIASLSVMTRTRVLVVILTHTDGRNYILKFLVTFIFEDYTHKRVSALTKLAECQLTLNTHKEHRNQI